MMKKLYFITSILFFSQFVHSQTLFTKSDTFRVKDTIRFMVPKHRGDLKWQFSTDSVNWSEISGETRDTFLFNSFDNLGHFRAQITEGTCDPIFTNVATLAHPYEIKNVFVETSFRSKELRLHVDYIQRHILDGSHFSVAVTELHSTGKGLPANQFSIEVNSTSEEIIRQDIIIPWENPNLWELGSSYLYMLNIKIVDGKGQDISVYHPVRFGFREIWTEGRELIMNGHPVKFRLAPLPSFDMTPAVGFFLEGIGFNTLAIQPNSGFWINGFPTSVRHAGSEELLNFADEQGWAVLMPAPSINSIQTFDEKTTTRYLQDFSTWRKQWDRQNRPSIIAWEPSMNMDGVLDPENFGIRPERGIWRLPLYNASNDLISLVDSTRLIIHHSSGAGTGNVEMSNIYLNFLPLQEREEYLSHWSEHGKKPWGSIEFGTPITGSFFRDRLGAKQDGVPYFTEYGAIYLGDKSYAMEKDPYIEAISDVEQTEAPTGMSPSGLIFKNLGYLGRVGEWSGYYELMHLFIRNTYRSWLAWGMNAGALPWITDLGFGSSPLQKPSDFHSQRWTGPTYADLPRLVNQWVAEGVEPLAALEKLKERPDWANPIYDAFREVMQPLQVFIGGKQERFTAKDHNYISGEILEKTIVAIWDGLKPKQVSVDWVLMQNGTKIGDGNEQFELARTAVEKRPIYFQVPEVEKRSTAMLRIEVRDLSADSVVSTDQFDLTFFPKLDNVGVLRSNWGIYDPEGKTTLELAKLGFGANTVTPGDDLRDIDVLIIGSRAFDTEKVLPFSPADIGRGLRVVMFEQTEEALQSLGFRTEDVVPRYVFPRVGDHPVLSGIGAEDLINWRGEGQFVPATKRNYYPNPDDRIHWGNYGSVASVVIETPHLGAFTPILETEFDLAYSPLLEWKHGKGEILFSQLDLTNRLGSEPVADLLLKNIIDYLDGSSLEDSGYQELEIICIGGTQKENEFLEELGFQLTNSSEIGNDLFGQLVVLGGGTVSGLNESQRRILEEHVESGGSVFVLPQTEDQIKLSQWPWPMRSKRVETARIMPDSINENDLLQGIGPQLLHWRTFLKLDLIDSVTLPEQGLFLDGLLSEVTDGQGSWVFCQMDWQQLDNGDGNLRLPHRNVRKLYRQLLTNLGAKTAADRVAEMFGHPSLFAPMSAVTLWRVSEQMEVWPWSLIESGSRFRTLSSLETGNLVGVQGKGDPAQRPVLKADIQDYVNFPASPKQGAVSYAETYIYSSTRRVANFSIQAKENQTWFAFRVNGNVAVDQSYEGIQWHISKLPEVVFSTTLEEGWNRLELVAISGNRLGFQVQVSDPGDLSFEPAAEKPQSVPDSSVYELLQEKRNDLLYARPRRNIDDPYRHIHW